MKPKGDWIKLYRKLLKSEIFANPDLLQAAVWCLLKAAHKPRTVVTSTGRGSVTVDIKPGQMVFGRKSAGQQLGCSEASAKRRILRLAKLGFLTCQPNTHFSVVTICNWDSYQSKSTKSDWAIKQASEHPSDKVTVQATVHKQEEIKNAQELKKPPTPSSTSISTEPRQVLGGRDSSPAVPVGSTEQPAFPQVRSGRLTFDRRMMPLPAVLDTPAFVAAWDRFLSHRVDKGSVTTEDEARGMLAKFSRYGPVEACEIIRRTIEERGWLSPDWPKDQLKKSTQASKGVFSGDEQF